MGRGIKGWRDPRREGAGPGVGAVCSGPRQTALEAAGSNNGQRGVLTKTASRARYRPRIDNGAPGGTQGPVMVREGSRAYSLWDGAGRAGQHRQGGPVPPPPPRHTWCVDEVLPP